MRLHAQEFLLQGGDAQWLRGLDYAPQKLRNLCEVITILAHKPWLIKTEHIEVGTVGVCSVCVCELQRWKGIQAVASSIKPFKDIYELFMSDCNFNFAIFLTGWEANINTNLLAYFPDHPESESKRRSNFVRWKPV